MLSEIKCTITKNDVLLKSLVQATDFNNFYETLDTFELQLNAVMTKLINDTGDSGADNHIHEESDDESDGEEVNEQFSPKKKKKT